MPSRRRSSGQRGAPKLFRCTGYGNCDMVFTRSEHLARHERKHTGEKPYKCVVPGCNRMFSRFDNMMQHTQTHEKHKKNMRSASEKINSRATQVHGHRNSMSNETPAKAESVSWNDQRLSSVADIPFEPSSMMSSRTLPLPTRRASFSSYGSMPYPPPPPPSNYRPSHYQVNPHPYSIDPAHNIPRNRSSWPINREPYQSYNCYYRPSPPPPQNYNNEYYDVRRRSSNSTISSDSTILSPTASAFDSQLSRRRISIDDLRLPIESLKNIHLDEDKTTGYNKINHDSIAITHDEFEALEGFGKFHSSSVVASERTSSAELTPSPVLLHESPTIAAQVYAMRQRVMTINESFQRR